MKTLTAVLCSALLAGSVHAAPFAKADPKAGKVLYDKACLACHAKMFGGDGSKIFTRADHTVKTAKQLADRIATCNANTGAGFFPEDEANVAAYLNQQYYKFK